MNTAPPVSVLLPVRDGQAHLQDAVASLEEQTFADYEVIAVDDGSVDATREILEEWRRRDSRVRVLAREARGIVAALEDARAAARGRYLARMDADDVSRPRRLALQFELMEADPTLAVVGSHVRYFPRATLKDGARRYERWMNATSDPGDVARDVFVECPLAHPSFFLRAERVAVAGGYRDAGWPEDYDLILRLWEAGGRLAKVPEVLLEWRDSPGRLSRTHPSYAPEAFRACKIHFLRRTLLAHDREAVVWGAGPVGKALARGLLEAGTRVRAFVEVDPRKIGQEIHGAPVFDTSAGLDLEGPLHVGAVGQEGTRATIRDLLAGAGKAELSDFVVAA